MPQAWGIQSFWGRCLQAGFAEPRLLLHKPQRLGLTEPRHEGRGGSDQHHPGEVSEQCSERTSLPAPTPVPWESSRRTYAGRDGRAALLVALGAAVARDAGNAVLAGTLASGLVAGFAGSAHRVAITGCGKHTQEVRRWGGPVHTSLGPSPPRGCPWPPPLGGRPTPHTFQKL